MNAYQYRLTAHNIARLAGQPMLTQQGDTVAFLAQLLHHKLGRPRPVIVLTHGAQEHHYLQRGASSFLSSHSPSRMQSPQNK